MNGACRGRSRRGKIKESDFKRGRGLEDWGTGVLWGGGERGVERFGEAGATMITCGRRAKYLYSRAMSLRLDSGGGLEGLLEKAHVITFLAPLHGERDQLQASQGWAVWVSRFSRNPTQSTPSHTCRVALPLKTPTPTRPAPRIVEMGGWHEARQLCFPRNRGRGLDPGWRCELITRTSDG